ncbi:MULTISPECIES: NAD-dependent epimerase/dehydratase family protein [Bacillus]|uniref:NAD-dependent epimerase/dehydratase family protein n=1 Tax=Bacillus TaxID=1386 RepID=UPI00031D4E6F
MRKILILGASGLIGSAIVTECSDTYDVYGTYHSKPVDLPSHKQYQLEIGQKEKFIELISSLEPDVVISCLRGDFQKQVELHQQLALELQKKIRHLSTFLL